MFRSAYFQSLDPTQLKPLLSDWARQSPSFGILAFVSEASKAAIPDLQEVCRTLSLPLCGAMFPAVIHETAFEREGVVLIGFESGLAYTLVHDVGHSAKDAAQRIRQELNGHIPREEGTETPTLFLICDGMLPNIGSVLTELFSLCHTHCRYSGVNAGSETFQPMPCLFDQEQFVGDAILGLALPAEFIAELEHGYPVSKTLMHATSTEGNRIDKIDGRPALGVYQDVIRREFGIELTQENFYDYAVHYPFGLISTLEILVRIPVAFTVEGGLFCVGEIPGNAMLRLIQAPESTSNDCATHLAERMQFGQPNTAPALLFYCAGRRMHFGESASQELAAFKTHTRGRSILGALTLGEIETSKDLGFPEFHNAAMVCVSQPGR